MYIPKCTIFISLTFALIIVRPILDFQAFVKLNQISAIFFNEAWVNSFAACRNCQHEVQEAKNCAIEGRRVISHEIGLVSKNFAQGK